MISSAGNDLNEVFTERELGLLQLSTVLIISAKRTLIMALSVTRLIRTLP